MEAEAARITKETEELEKKQGGSAAAAAASGDASKEKGGGSGDGQSRDGCVLVSLGFRLFNFHTLRPIADFGWK